jgi:alpha-L-fucosidase
MSLFKNDGAKYFVSMGSHHDNFFLWNSALHPWNSANYGPHKDVVGLWKEAAKKEGLRFGVSEHLGASFTWFQTSHGADKAGPKAGIPYDGNDPMYQDLYHAKADSADSGWLSKNKEWQREWMFYIKELLDNYQPDLLYSDSSFPFGEYGRHLIAYFYNRNMKQNDGKLEAVYTCKQASQGMWVEDIERGLKDSISEIPWQIDTSIGDWYYRTGQEYKTSADVIKMLVDVVSKNGNLLINIVQTPEGDIESDVLEIVEEIGQWMSANGEGIYGTRPWKIKYTAEDIRFTTKGDVLYAFCLGKSTGKIRITSLGKITSVNGKAIKSVKMLGSNQIIKWKQSADALVIDHPSKLPVEKVPVPGFKIEFE